MPQMDSYPQIPSFYRSSYVIATFRKIGKMDRRVRGDKEPSVRVKQSVQYKRDTQHGQSYYDYGDTATAVPEICVVRHLFICNYFFPRKPWTSRTVSTTWLQIIISGIFEILDKTW